MSKKLIFAGLLLALVWPVSARDLGAGNGIPGKDLSNLELLGPAESDIVVVPGYSYRYNYNHNGIGRGTADTLAYDYDWGAYFYMEPGDVMMTVFQAPADMTVKGVNVPVHRWGTGEQLTVSVHKVSYPYGSDGTMYDQSAVDADGWLAGYDDDGDGIMTYEGTTWNSAVGGCGDNTMINNAQDPLGSVHASAGPPGTPTMGLLWPDGFTAATLDPTNNPGIDVGGGSNWVDLIDYGSEAELLAGEWVGIVVSYTGTGGDGSDVGIGFQYASFGGSPWVSSKFYSACGSAPGGESGWHIRSWVFNYQLAVDLTGDRGPVFASIGKLPTTLSTGDRTVTTNVTDDNPSGEAAGVAAVTLSYQLDSLTAPINTVSLTMTSGTAEDGTWEGIIPGQSIGTWVYWDLVATDVGALSTSSNAFSYTIFEAHAGNDLIFNNQDPLYGSIIYASYLYFYTGYSTFDIWDASYGGIVDELTGHYTTIVELGSDYDNDAEIAAWWSGDKTYIVSGDEWLGARSGWTDGPTADGSVAKSILGVAYEYNDINYGESGDQHGISRLMAGTDGAASVLAGFLSDSLYLNYDPDYETGRQNWLDGVDAVDGYTVDMTGWSFVLDSADAITPVDTAVIYDVMIHGQQGNGGKSAFLAFDVMALNTVPSYYWIGASAYMNANGYVNPADASPLIAVYNLLDGITSVEDGIGTPNAFSLKGNYPNPFNPSTNIAFNLDIRSDVTVTVYSLLGEEVATINNSAMQPGLQSVKWNGTDSQGIQVASGVYIYRVEVQNRALTGKMLLLK